MSEPASNSSRTITEALSGDDPVAKQAALYAANSHIRVHPAGALAGVLSEEEIVSAICSPPRLNTYFHKLVIDAIVARHPTTWVRACFQPSVDPLEEGHVYRAFNFGLAATGEGGLSAQLLKEAAQVAEELTPLLMKHQGGSLVIENTHIAGAGERVTLTVEFSIF